MIRGLASLSLPSHALTMPSTAHRGPDARRRPQQLRPSVSSRSTPSRRAFTIENVGKEPVAVSIETGFVPDDFSPGQRLNLPADRVDDARSPARAAPTWSGTTPTRRRRSSATAGSNWPSWRVTRRHKPSPRKTSVVTAAGRRRTCSTSTRSSVSFGEQPFETFETRSFTVTNAWSHTIQLTSDPGPPDDFSHLIDSTCGIGDRTLTAQSSRTHVIGFRPTQFFAGLETATSG